ncbi:MAG: hypothetical protein OEV64_07120 [Desulfobulbaceae bacterium]|nr:hypothetical protein [Desulfobulbaceae bacterium]
MKKYKFSREFIVGLIACLNQAALSLHRATSTSQLIAFYKEEKRHDMLNMILNFLQPRYTKSINDQVGMLGEIWLKFLSWYSWKIFKVANLPDKTVYCAVNELKAFLAILEEQPNIFPKNRIELRMNLNKVAEEIASYVPDRSLVKKTQKVCHVNQAKHLSLYEVEEIAGSQWLDISFCDRSRGNGRP